MWVIFVIVFDPIWKLLQNGQGIRTRLDPRVVKLERLNEGLADTIAFGAADRREAWHQSEGRGERQCIPGGEGRAIVCQPLNGMRCPDGVEAPLDAGEHEISHHLPTNTASAGLPGDDLPVAGIDGEDKANNFTIPATDLQTIG